jgi:hypothetical protein
MKQVKYLLVSCLAILLFWGTIFGVAAIVYKTSEPHTEYRWAEIVDADSSAGVLFCDTEGELWYYEADDLDPNGFYVLYIDTNGTKTLEDDEILKIFQER